MTEEEKEMKYVMEIVEGQTGGKYVETKEEAIEYIDTYAEHLYNELGYKYRLMPDDQVNALMCKFISEFKSNEMISNDYGYQLSENLQNFDDYIRENMETAYIEYLEKSD